MIWEMLRTSDIEACGRTLRKAEMACAIEGMERIQQEKEKKE